MRIKKVVTLCSVVLICTVLGIAIPSLFDFQGTCLAKDTPAASGATDFLNTFNDALSAVAEKAKPSVVNISTTSTVKMDDSPFSPFFNDPFFRRFFGDEYPHPGHGPQRRFKTAALGSGVIFTEDGYIITNNHVVKGADEIKVILNDKREFSGKVIGTDPKTDLAVIKIDAKDLPAIAIGDSAALKAGEIVIAIGNPFALSQTITMGVVSAVGRSNVGISDYEDYIQTDAAINPGNSGGALVNIRGELVGINTAIFSTSGGYMGVGFAIPSSMADAVMKSIIKHGKVIRGWIGVTIQELTPELAGHFDLKEEKGALVADIAKDSPAEKAGLQRGDLITGFDGKTIENTNMLRNLAAETPPGRTVKIRFIREKKEQVLEVTLGEFPETVSTFASADELDNALKGVHVQDLSPEIKSNLDIPQKVEGVIVTNVEDDSPASDAIRQNDVIQEINRKEIRNTKDYEKAASMTGPDDSLLLLVYREGGYIYITIKP